MELKIIDEYLDTMVYNPYTNQPIILRFLKREMYQYMSIHYPYMFEAIEIKKKGK